MRCKAGKTMKLVRDLGGDGNYNEVQATMTIASVHHELEQGEADRCWTTSRDPLIEQDALWSTRRVHSFCPS